MVATSTPWRANVWSSTPIRTYPPSRMFASARMSLASFLSSQAIAALTSNAGVSLGGTSSCPPSWRYWDGLIPFDSPGTVTGGPALNPPHLPNDDPHRRSQKCRSCSVAPTTTTTTSSRRAGRATNGKGIFPSRQPLVEPADTNWCGLTDRYCALREQGQCTAQLQAQHSGLRQRTWLVMPRPHSPSPNASAVSGADRGLGWVSGKCPVVWGH